MPKTDVSRPGPRNPRPLWLMRRWKSAAGPLASWYIPAAPFTALQLYGTPQIALRERLNPARLDNIAETLAGRLLQTDEGLAVQGGEAAIIIDLPGSISVGLGFFLQKLGITPVLLFNGLYRPASLVEGKNSLPAIIRYGSQVEAWSGQPGYAFLLERERTGPEPTGELAFWRTFDNRYHAGEHLFPPLEKLKAGGVSALIDLRLAGDELPHDVNRFYRAAARAGLDVFQAALPPEWLTGQAEGQPELQGANSTEGNDL
ncbi:MAG: hypothetical protein J0I20_28580 [Chloroflexi bacterium]|nr:hypothetical protein [Chloroflexota bacterium]